jgi:hypothetical protein
VLQTERGVEESFAEDGIRDWGRFGGGDKAERKETQGSRHTSLRHNVMETNKADKKI